MERERERERESHIQIESEKLDSDAVWIPKLIQLSSSLSGHIKINEGMFSVSHNSVIPLKLASKTTQKRIGCGLK